MLTRSTRKLPPDFNENQPIGRRGLINAYAQRQQILASHPTLPAAFPTLDRPPTPKPAGERPLWIRGASAGGDDNGRKTPQKQKRRIDMTEDDLLMELAGDNTFLNAPIGFAEAELPLFGQGHYEETFVPPLNDDFQLDLGQKLLDDLDPGELDLPLFFDEDSSQNWGLDIAAKISFKELSSGVKMAIMIECAALEIENVPETLGFTPEDIDDYVKLYDREAANDAAKSYNINNDHDWELMHRMAGRTDFEEHHPPQRRPTYRSALSLILRKDVDAGQRYLNMIGQCTLVNRLEAYVGCAAPGAFVFEQPKEMRRSGRAQEDKSVQGSAEASDRLQALSLYSTDEEIVIRERRRGPGSIAGSVVSSSEEPVVQRRVRGRPRPARAPASVVRTVIDLVDGGQDLAKDDSSAVPLLARPPKRPKVMHPRPEQLRLPDLVHSTRIVPGPPDVASPENRVDSMPTKEHTPPASVSQLVREMSSTKRRAMSRPEDEPQITLNTSSPILPAFATPRGPRVAHLERPGQNPTRHSSGTHPKSGSRDEGETVRTVLKTKRQLSGVYRPERQWADQASSSPLRSTTPRPATPRSGSKEHFLIERHPSHPPSSPRIFDEAGKTVRKRPHSPEEVKRIFKLQDEAAKIKARNTRLGQLMPDHMLPPQRSSDEAVGEVAKTGERQLPPAEVTPYNIQEAAKVAEERERKRKIILARIEPESLLPPPRTPQGYQAPFSSAKLSNQQPSRHAAQEHSTPRRPEPTLPPLSNTPSGYQAPFSGLMRSKQTIAQDMAPRQTAPILPPPRPARLNSQPPDALGGILAVQSSQRSGVVLTSTSASCQSEKRILDGASFSGPHGSKTQPQQSTSQTGAQAPAWAHCKRPEVIPEASQGRPMKVKVRRTKTNTHPVESTQGRLSPVRFDSVDKPLGPPKLKSTYKAQTQPRPDERHLYVTPQRREHGPEVNASNGPHGSISSATQLPNQQGRPNAIRRAYTVQGGASSTGNGTRLPGEQPLGQQPGVFGYYQNSFAAHPQATFDGTVKDFSRDVSHQKHPNQHTSSTVNPLQVPQNFNAPRANQVGRQNSMVNPQPNPFRGVKLQASQAPNANATAAHPPPRGADQYYSQQHQQSPAKKQKIGHEPQGPPERSHWDRTQRSSTPARTGAIPGSFAQSAAPSNGTRDVTPTPNMPNNCLSGVLGVASSDVFAKAMKSHGVALPQISQNAAVKSKKRNVASKAVAAPMSGTMTGTPGSRTTNNGPNRPRGGGKASGAAMKRKEEKGPKQSSISHFLKSPRRPSGGGGMF